MKKKIMEMVALFAIVAVVAFGASTVYAAVGDQSVNKVGTNYVVDTVTAERMDGNVLVQTIERRYIPETEYNSAGKTAQLRTAIAGALQANGYIDNVPGTTAYNYQWTVTSKEVSAGDCDVYQDLIFRHRGPTVSEAHFRLWAHFDANGSPVVQYYWIENGSFVKDKNTGLPLEITAEGINTMLIQYGSRRPGT